MGLIWCDWKKIRLELVKLLLMTTILSARSFLGNIAPQQMNTQVYKSRKKTTLELSNNARSLLAGGLDDFLKYINDLKNCLFCEAQSKTAYGV